MTDGATALLLAAQGGLLEVFWFLVAATKDESMPNGATPLYVAALKGRLEVVRFLVESGCQQRTKV